MKTRKWNEVRRGSRVILSKAFNFIGLDCEKKTLPVGKYWVSGFWGNACGLSFQRRGYNDIVIPSITLKNFDGITEA